MDIHHTTMTVGEGGFNHHQVGVAPYSKAQHPPAMQTPS